MPGKFHENAEFEIDNAAKATNLAAQYAVDVNVRKFRGASRCRC